MNWEAAGAIGEVLGSIVVSASLIYIAIQVRETKVATAPAARIERNNAFSKTMLETPEISEIVAKINEVDGSDPFVSEMQKTYGLTAAQAELYYRLMNLTTGARNGKNTAQSCVSRCCRTWLVEFPTYVFIRPVP
jgi:hypothetical protein